jgi:radical SAM superfamily enzyme YgiQ (UPF0313 family)
VRIALIAMSGVRACDQELFELGLTLPGFVERSKIVASLPSLGLLTLAGMTPSDHEIDYIESEDLFIDGSYPELPQGYDLVGISTYSAQIGEAYQLADRYRTIGHPVVMGGPHVSVLTGEALYHCDGVVVGEGELHWRRVLEDAERGKLQPVYGSLDEEFDIARAPMPAFGLLDITRYNRLTVQTSRGCPHQCEFCGSSVLIAGRYKQKPADKVLAEIDAICGIWENPFIEFADDNTFVNHAYWKKLLPRIAGRRIRWFTETDVSVAEDEEMLELMREAGCAQVLIGFESPERGGLDGVEVRGNWKHGKFDGYREAIDRIQSHGISVNGCFVLGLDGHGPDIFDRVFDFVKSTGLYEVQITLLTAFPGTLLYHRLKEEGRLMEERAWEKCTLFDLNFQPLSMTAEELQAGFRDLGVRLYSDEFTRWRRRQFRSRIRSARRKASTERRR